MYQNLAGGRYKGTLQKFNANGAIKTDAGRIKHSAEVSFSDSLKFKSATGEVVFTNLNIGALAEERSLGKANGTVKVKATPETVVIENGKVSTLEFNNYKYQDLIFEGRYQNDNITAHLVAADTNLKADIAADINLQNSTPQFVFNGSIEQMNMKELNFSRMFYPSSICFYCSISIEFL